MLASATSGRPRIGGGSFGFNKRADEIVGVDMHDPERGRLAERNLGQPTVTSAACSTCCEHLFVVHL
jgi:hypothetical protein